MMRAIVIAFGRTRSTAPLRIASRKSCKLCQRLDIYQTCNALKLDSATAAHFRIADNVVNGNARNFAQYPGPSAK
jgi:hypothetical protein